MNNVKLTQKGTKLVIEIDLSVAGEPPRNPGTKGPSDKGTKGWAVASSHGFVDLESVNGRRMKLNLHVSSSDAPKGD
jgi:hypothetical protein